MGEKRRKLYKFISLCAKEDVDTLALDAQVLQQFLNISSRQIMKASLLAFTDRKLRDQAAFDRIADLAVRTHRLELRKTGEDVPVVTAETSELMLANEASETSAEEIGVSAGAETLKTPVVRPLKQRSRKQKISLNGISPS